MKKVASFVIASCLVFSCAASAFAAPVTHDKHHAKTHAKHHATKLHAKAKKHATKLHAKQAGKKQMLRMKATTPTMPKTGFGGASK